LDFGHRLKLPHLPHLPLVFDQTEKLYH